MSRVLAGRYELSHLVSEGPVFAVWSAKDRVGAREVSVRILQPPYDREAAFHEGLRATLHEIHTLKHPCLERIGDFDQDGDTHFLVGDAVRGMPLDERIRKLAPFSVPVAVGAAITICEALSSIHRAGIVHGDVGAHNVRVLPEGSAIVQQAGLWRAYGASRSAGAAVLPQMAAYLAPEIGQGSMPTASSDVYAVGVILYQLLTGVLPFVADQPIAQAMKHVHEPVPSVREANSQVPVALDEVVKKAMAKERVDRYPSASELLSDLRMIQDAMRFGRNLAWPLQPSSSPGDETLSEAGATRPVPIVRKRTREVEPSDVPIWLKGALVFFAALAVMMVGTWFVVNLRKPRLVTVPDLHRLTIAKAEEAVKPLHLKLHVTKKVMNEQVPADVILDTDPTPGERIYEGGTINVQVSAGSRFVEVPDLRGMTADKARILLDSLGLRLDDRVEEEYDRDAEKGMILKQVPEARTRVERKTAIRVVASSGKDPPVRNPRDNTKYIYTVRIELSDIVEPVLMRVDMTDNRGTKTISEERRQPGEVVELTAEGYGSQAIFKVFYNGEPITQVTKQADEESPTQ